jgi:ABC-type glutathione transport system ATPase component
MTPPTNRIELANSAVLTVRGLSKDFVEKRPFSRSRVHATAFADVHLTVRRATTLAIVGESGAGKSTLARCLALLERPTRGEIWFEGQHLATLTKRELRPIRGKIQMIFQDPASALNPGMMAEEIIVEPLVIQRVGTMAERRARAIELLREVGLDEGAAKKRPFEFSGGQKQRLAIARALVLTPGLLILDEACSGLDLKTQQVILELLTELRATRGMSFIYISHDLRTVAEFADEIAVMHRGRIVEQNAPNKLLDDPRDPYTRNLLAGMPSLEAICQQRLVGALQ